MQSALVFGSIDIQMSRRVLIFALTFLFALSAGAPELVAQSTDPGPLPRPTEPVNDFAGVLGPGTVADLNRKIKEFKERTNPQVVLAVAIVRTTEDRDIFDYSLSVARGWKVGTDKEDNPSALLFIAIDDRKYFTQISRDLEDELPDGLAGQLQRKHLVPAFRQRDYDKGVSDTIDAYIATISERSGTAAPAEVSRPAPDSEPGETTWGDICSIAFVILILILFFVFGGRRRGGFFPMFISFGGGGGGDSGWGGGSDFGGFGGGDFGGGGSGGDW